MRVNLSKPEPPKPTLSEHPLPPPAAERLWLGLFFPDLPLEIVDQPPQTPLAILERRRVLQVNPEARAQGVAPGQKMGHARALCGELICLERDPALEEQALQDLAHWAYHFTPHIECRAGLLLLEVSASLRLFGGREALLAELRRDLQRGRHRVAMGLAPVAEQARVLARAAAPGADPEESPSGPAELDGLPLSELPLPGRERTALWRSGIRTLGQLRRLPRAELGRRLGRAPLAWLQQLEGHHPTPLPLWHPPLRFRRSLLLAAPTRRSEALLFSMQRLLGALMERLAARQLYILELEWHLYAESGPPETLRVACSQPQWEARALLELSRLQLERMRLPEPATRIDLYCQHFQPRQPASRDLFGSLAAGGDASDPSGNRSSADQGPPRELLDRLCARLGPEAISAPGCSARYLPEQAHRDDGATTSPRERGPLPLWLLPAPAPLALRDGVPYWRGRELTLLRGPERLQGEWWSPGAERGRDYYIAGDTDGCRYWVFRARKRWYLHGLYG